MRGRWKVGVLGMMLAVLFLACSDGTPTTPGDTQSASARGKVTVVTQIPDTLKIEALQIVNGDDVLVSKRDYTVTGKLYAGARETDEPGIYKMVFQVGGTIRARRSITVHDINLTIEPLNTAGNLTPTGDIWDSWKFIPGELEPGDEQEYTVGFRAFGDDLVVQDGFRYLLDFEVTGSP